MQHGKVICPQTGSRWLRRQTPKGTTRHSWRQGSQEPPDCSSKFTSGVATCRLVAHEGRSLGYFQVPRDSAKQPLRNQASSQHCPHLPRRAAHLCAGTRQCSQRWTSAPRLGPAAGC